MIAKWLVVGALALAGCSASNAEPTTSTPTPSISETVDQLAAFNELNNAVVTSLSELESVGTVSIYNDNGAGFFLEVYDPNSTYDYRGVGWLMESDEIELLLDLNMFSLYQVQMALETAEPAEVHKLSSSKFRFSPTNDIFSDEITVTVNGDGLISAIDLPSSESPDSIIVSYGMDEFADSLIKRANEELLG